MQISTRFTVALHIFTCVEAFRGEYKVTSDFLAASINTNPVIVRKILSQLSRAGLISVARGTGGIELVRPPEENIHALLDQKLLAIQQAMESKMREFTVGDLRDGIRRMR